MLKVSKLYKKEISLIICGNGNSLILFLIILVFSTCKKDPKIDLKQSIEKDGWTLTFNDEFENSTLDTSKWGTGEGFGKEEEMECYRSKNISVKDGLLYLTVIPEISDCSCGYSYSCQKDYTSGMITSGWHFEQQYGYFESRIKIPKGQGLWPALWMCARESWPPEIDLFEFQGIHPEILYAGHAKEKPEDGSRNHFKFADLSQEFHTYAVEWNSKEIKWYCDNVVFFKSRKNIPNKPMFMLLTMQIGSGFSGYPDNTTPFPSSMVVDFVRIYQKR